MAKEKFRSSIEIGGKERIDVGLSILIWKDENDIHYYYSPALDITGYGKSETDARKSFEFTLNDFVTYTHNKKTIFEELEKLGWTINKKKKRAIPPTEEELLKDNENYKNLYKTEGVRQEQQQIELAL